MAARVRSKKNGVTPSTSGAPAIPLRGKTVAAPLDRGTQVVELKNAAATDSSERFLGHLDPVVGRIVAGWARDTGNPRDTVSVEVFEGGRLLGEAKADRRRDDLARNGTGNGRHGFEYLLPLDLFGGRDRVISARIKGAGIEIGGSPRTLPGVFPDLPAAAVPSDQQAMLATLQAMAQALQTQNETLATQTRALQQLLERVAASPDAPPPLPVPEPQYEDGGPLVRAALRRKEEGYDFIFFSIIDWNFRIQRPQHLAQWLASMGHRVFYLSVQFEDPGIARRGFRILSEPVPGVFECRLYCGSPAPNLYAGIDAPQHIAELTSALARAAARLRLRSTVGIVQFPGWYPIAASLPGMTMVYDCLDHIAGFTNVAPCIVDLERALIKNADSVIVTSRYLADHVGRHRVSDLVPNAAEVEYFSERPETVWQGSGRPVIGYYGAISHWFDAGLVAHCARAHPEWDFLLIGSTDGCDTTVLADLANVILLGEQPYSTLTQYLYAFDVCTIPFQVNELIKATNPVKLYEYLCSGKPLVATDLPDLHQVPANLIRLARDPDEFERHLVAALAEPDKKLPGRRKSWAQQHSWAARAEAFVTAIDRRFPLVSVIVLSYNQLSYTRTCLASLWEHTDYPNIEVICVDNASTDGTIEFLWAEEEKRPNLRVIQTDANLGFAGGNNVGMRAARGDIVILLNNDTYVTKGWVRDLIRPLLLDPEIGMTGPVTNMTGNEQKLAINYADMTEMRKNSGMFTATHRYQRFEPHVLAFFCVAIRRDVIEKIGGLSEEYGRGYFEDDDYCAAARHAGYRLAICDDVFIHHHHSASFGALPSPERVALMDRNRKIYEAKWGKWRGHAYRSAPGFGE